MNSKQEMSLPVRPANQDLIPSATNSKGLQLDPTRLLSSDDRKVDFALVESLAGKSIVEVKDLDRTTVIELCKFAALLEVTEIASHHPLDGKLVVTAFFEPSTRTRLSFESAVLRLDGKVLSVPDGRTTGVAKGESLADIGEMLNTYGDLVVLRHTETDCIERIRRNLKLPLVNAGNGSGEHPTQALLDWYTILKWRPTLIRPEAPKRDRIHLGVVGTPGSMRAVKSFVYMALFFASNIRKLTVISEMRDPFGPELAAALKESGITVEVTGSLEGVVSDLDVVYINSIAYLGDSYRRMDSRFSLSAKSPLKPDAVVMHPLARGKELDTSLDDTQHNLYFAEAASAVFARQALLIGLLGRVGALPPSILLLTT